MDGRSPFSYRKPASMQAKCTVQVAEKNINAKSIMGMMTLGLVTGESITVEADGTDEEQAVAEIEKYLQKSDKEWWERQSLL